MGNEEDDRNSPPSRSPRTPLHHPRPPDTLSLRGPPAGGGGGSMAEDTQTGAALTAATGVKRKQALEASPRRPVSVQTPTRRDIFSISSREGNKRTEATPSRPPPESRGSHGSALTNKRTRTRSPTLHISLKQPAPSLASEKHGDASDKQRWRRAAEQQDTPLNRSSLGLAGPRPSVAGGGGRKSSKKKKLV